MNKNELTDLLRRRNFKRLFDELGWDNDTPASPVTLILPDHSHSR